MNIFGNIYNGKIPQFRLDPEPRLDLTAVERIGEPRRPKARIRRYDGLVGSEIVFPCDRIGNVVVTADWESHVNAPWRWAETLLRQQQQDRDKNLYRVLITAGMPSIKRGPWRTTDFPMACSLVTAYRLNGDITIDLGESGSADDWVADDGAALLLWLRLNLLEQRAAISGNSNFFDEIVHSDKLGFGC